MIWYIILFNDYFVHTLAIEYWPIRFTARAKILLFDTIDVPLKCLTTLELDSVHLYGRNLGRHFWTTANSLHEGVIIFKSRITKGFLQFIEEVWSQGARSRLYGGYFNVDHPSFLISPMICDWHVGVVMQQQNMLRLLMWSKATQSRFKNLQGCPNASELMWYHVT